jgi:hypothetical protein
MFSSIPFSELTGKTLKSIDGLYEGSECVTLVTTDDECYQMHHHQSCCERVSIEDIIGEVEDLIDSPITMAEDETSGENPDDVPSEIADYQESSSYTWTFYKLATAKGYVTIRWYGTSNGYYSEEVAFEKLKKD